MPSALDNDGPYDYYVPSGDHRPPHVHVEHEDDGAIFYLFPVELRDNFGIAEHRLTEIREEIQANRVEIFLTWRQYSG